MITNCISHVGSRGNRRMPIYHEPRDYDFFLQLLRDDARALGALIHGYCLMTNHFHLVIEVGHVSLSKVMHAILQRHAMYMNRRYGFSGHLFSGRFWLKVCDSEAYALAMVSYVHHNPCRAGIAATPEGYPWSTHRVYLGTLDVPWVTTRLLDLFSADRPRAHAAYARFMRESEVASFRDRVFE